MKIAERKFTPTERVILLTTADLMKKLSWTKITVEAIVKKAGISKATFYRHFKDKDDLLYSMVIQQVELLYSEKQESEDLLDWVTELLKRLRRGRDLWMKLQQDNPFLASDVLESLFSELLHDRFSLIQHRVPNQREAVLIDCLSAGSARRVFHWFMDGCSETMDAMGQDIIDLYLNPKARGIFGL